MSIELVKIINEIRDNIWIRDYQAAKTLIESSVKQINQSQLMQMIELEQSLRQKIYELRKTVPEEFKGKNRRAWIRTQLFENLKRNEIDPVWAIEGVYLIELLGFKDYIEILIEPKESQDNFSPQKEELFVSNKEGYKYSIEHIFNRWTVRVIFDRQPEKPSADMKDYILNKDVFMDEWEAKNSYFSELFGKEMHVQVVVVGKLMEITISIPRSTDEHSKVALIAEDIINRFRRDKLNSY